MERTPPKKGPGLFCAKHPSGRSGKTNQVPFSVPMILRARWPTLFVVAVLSAAAGVLSTRITVDTSLDTWFVEDDDALVRYREFRREFGEDEFIVLAVEADDVFTPEVLGEVDRLTRAASAIPRVRRATGVTNVKVPRRAGRSVRVEPLAMPLPESAEQAAALRQRAASNPMIAGNLVSDDGRAAAILVQLSRECDTFAKKAAVVHALRELKRDATAGVTVRLAGSPVVNDAISRYTQRDLSILTPVAFVIAALSILLLFRRPAVPAIAMGVVGLATLWVMGLIGLLGWQINLLTPALVMIILVVGVADSIHIFAAYFQELDGTRTPAAAMHRALGHVLAPCMVTSLTTMAGFLSLLSSSLEPIRRFGTLAAVGAGLAYFLSIFLIPATMRLVPAGRRPAAEASGRSPMDKLLNVLGRPTRRRSLAVILVSLLIVVAGAWSIQYLGVTANPMNYFEPGDPVRRDVEAIEADLGGAASLEFIVRAPNGGMTDLDVLRRLDAFGEWLEKLPSITRVDSLPSLLKDVDGMDDADREGRLPRSPIGLLWTLDALEMAAPDLLASRVRNDYSLGRISVRVKSADADKLAALGPRIEDVVRNKINGPKLQVLPTGFVILMDEMRTYLIRSQITSVLIAFGTITLVLFALFRSWKLALFSMIPNMGPILLGLALMVALGIQLDPGTVMIATIALGLVVDDTCHFLVHLRRYVAQQKSVSEAIALTMQQTGRPIILTSLILAAGFAALLLGSFHPTIWFGLISAFVLLVALVADLVMLPAALVVLRPKL